jgi:uncharacterized protein (DUF2235 family)
MASSKIDILKIVRMLDRSPGKGFHGYQPGIGTCVASSSLDISRTIQKMKNCYVKAKQSAIGTSFDEHVVGGYSFLMKYHAPTDYIYFFRVLARDLFCSLPGRNDRLGWLDQ